MCALNNTDRASDAHWSLSRNLGIKVLNWQTEKWYIVSSKYIQNVKRVPQEGECFWLGVRLNPHEIFKKNAYATDWDYKTI